MRKHPLVFTFILCITFSCPVLGQHEKAVVNQVFERLINSIGLSSKERPLITLVERETQVASYMPGGRNEIFFELKAYRICQAMGPDSMNGIAFILGHELGHWFNNHYFLNEASTAYASIDLGEQLANAKKANDSTIAHELQADEFACYYSKMAGFSLNSIENFIRSIYKGYNLPDSIPRYPNLNARCGIAHEAKERMESLNRIFNYANILLLNNDYRSAAILYKHILINKFGSREIKNNLGICYAMQGLQCSNAAWKNLLFPFMLDPSSRAGEGYRDAISPDSIKMKDHFKEADRYFKEASELDQEYYPSRINSALISALLGNYKSAIRKLDELRDLVNDTPSLNQIAYGNAMVNFISTGDTSAFVQLARLGNVNARINLDRIANPTQSTQSIFRFPSSNLVTTIQPAIRKSLYINSQIERNRNITVYSRDTLNIGLVLLNITGSENKLYQIVSGQIVDIWPEGIDNEYSSIEPDFVQELGSGRIEKRMANNMTFYTLKVSNQEVNTYVLY